MGDKKKCNEKFSKTLEVSEKKHDKESTSKLEELKSKTAARDESKAKASEKEEKNPFTKVKEINQKLVKMKMIYDNKKSSDEKKIKEMTKEESAKFTQAKEQFFKKEGTAKKELKEKKSAFEEKCEAEKEILKKKSAAAAAYQESKSKKMCVKTRVASEINNKKMVQYYNTGIKNLKANCEKANALYNSDREEFVKGVCKTIRADIKGAVSNWMSTNYKIDIGV